MTSSANDLIMIVEDDPDTQEALRDILAQFDYRTIVASNGREALDRLRAKGEPRPCIILLDVMMPVMDGWQFRAEQRADPAIASIPVIFVTADLRAREALANTSGVGFIPKPVQVLDLVKAVRAVC